ncbi:unnamed protein product, partial [Phaeothamnion confervicola]
DEPGSTTTVAGGAVPSGSNPATNGQPFAGSVVTIAGTVRATAADRLQSAWQQFEADSGIDLQYIEVDSSLDFLTLAQGAGTPDLALVQQPTLAQLVEAGEVVPLDLLTRVESDAMPGAAEMGSIDGTFYAPPFDINPGSVVWYSPAAFASRGYEVPTTYADMLALSESIADDGAASWCVGAESGLATGWPLTYWVDELVVRTGGTDAYDRWISHDLAFSDPTVTDAIDDAGAILLRDDFVLNGVASIPSTSFQEAGFPLLDEACFMHHQGSFYRDLFPEGTTFGPDGDINAFYFPVVAVDDPRPMVANGSFIAALVDQPEVAAVAQFLTSAEYADERMALGGWFSPNTGVDASVMTDPLDRAIAQMLLDCDLYRQHATDLMPAQVGAGTFWSEMTAWV